MKERNLERLILFSLCFILILVVYTLISYMIVSNINFSWDSDSWGAFTNFFGSLFGALLTGAVAIIIMLKQNYDNKKEAHVSKYGSMKFIAIQLSSFKEHCNLIEYLIEAPKNNEYLKSNIDQIYRLMPIVQLKEIRILLENEREKIPYEFIVRYFTVINSINHIIRSIETFINTPNQITEDSLKKQIHIGQIIINGFRDNAFEFTVEVEKNFNFKDAY
ncbi:hypothetical protein ACOQFO_03715 [Ureibacillus sp. MALMAid1270]|uniref:hypothetical protein n=1 Tax=Ureibacillus sp. MALMAid1270 TaxID=3411629 RepID=UPI003BA6B57A